MQRITLVDNHAGPLLRASLKSMASQCWRWPSAPFKLPRFWATFFLVRQSAHFIPLREMLPLATASALAYFLSHSVALPLLANSHASRRTNSRGNAKFIITSVLAANFSYSRTNRRACTNQPKVLSTTHLFACGTNPFTPGSFFFISNSIS